MDGSDPERSQSRHGPRRSRTSGLHAALAVGLAACGGSGPQPVSPDGIPTYVVAEVPTLSIGTDTILGPFRLRQVSDATLQSDGSVVVVACEAAQLRWYDADGRHTRSVGEAGEDGGPFRIPQRMFRLGGDTLAVSDLLAGLTVIGPDGEVVETLAIGSPISGGRAIGRLADGRYVGRAYQRDDDIPSGTPYRTTASLILYSPSGEVLDSLSGLPASDVRSPTRERGPTLSLRLSRNAVFAVAEDRVYYGGQDGRGIVEYDTDLVPQRTINTVTRPEPVTPEVRAEDQRMRDERAYVAVGGITGATVDGYAPLLPAFRDLIAGRDGRLWVEDPERPWVHPLTWTAYEDGEPVARVEIPRRFFPFEFGEDWVLGVRYPDDWVAGQSFMQGRTEIVELRQLVPGPLPGVTLPPRDAEPPAQPRCSGWSSR